jgi:antitoxin MazE
MKSTVKRWGNSAAVRIPASVLETTRLDLDDAVTIRAEKGRIIIEPLKRANYDLDTLLEGIRPENLHDMQDTGTPVGREIW